MNKDKGFLLRFVDPSSLHSLQEFGEVLSDALASISPFQARLLDSDRLAVRVDGSPAYANLGATAQLQGERVGMPSVDADFVTPEPSSSQSVRGDDVPFANPVVRRLGLPPLADTVETRGIPPTFTVQPRPTEAALPVVSSDVHFVTRTPLASALVEVAERMPFSIRVLSSPSLETFFSDSPEPIADAIVPSPGVFSNDDGFISAGPSSSQRFPRVDVAGDALWVERLPVPLAADTMENRGISPTFTVQPWPSEPATHDSSSELHFATRTPLASALVEVAEDVPYSIRDFLSQQRFAIQTPLAGSLAGVAEDLPFPIRVFSSPTSEKFFSDYPSPGATDEPDQSSQVVLVGTSEEPALSRRLVLPDSTAEASDGERLSPSADTAEEARKSTQVVLPSSTVEASTDTRFAPSPTAAEESDQSSQLLFSTRTAEASEEPSLSPSLDATVVWAEMLRLSPSPDVAEESVHSSQLVLPSATAEASEEFRLSPSPGTVEGTGQSSRLILLTSTAEMSEELSLSPSPEVEESVQSSQLVLVSSSAETPMELSLLPSASAEESLGTSQLAFASPSVEAFEETSLSASADAEESVQPSQLVLPSPTAEVSEQLSISPSPDAAEETGQPSQLVQVSSTAEASEEPSLSPSPEAQESVQLSQLVLASSTMEVSEEPSLSPSPDAEESMQSSQLLLVSSNAEASEETSLSPSPDTEESLQSSQLLVSSTVEASVEPSRFPSSPAEESVQSSLVMFASLTVEASEEPRVSPGLEAEESMQSSHLVVSSSTAEAAVEATVSSRTDTAEETIQLSQPVLLSSTAAAFEDPGLSPSPDAEEVVQSSQQVIPSTILGTSEEPRSSSELESSVFPSSAIQRDRSLSILQSVSAEISDEQPSDESTLNVFEEQTLAPIPLSSFELENLPADRLFSPRISTETAAVNPTIVSVSTVAFVGNGRPGIRPDMRTMDPRSIQSLQSRAAFSSPKLGGTSTFGVLRASGINGPASSPATTDQSVISSMVTNPLASSTVTVLVSTGSTARPSRCSSGDPAIMASATAQSSVTPSTGSMTIANGVTASSLPTPSVSAVSSAVVPTSSRPRETARVNVGGEITVSTTAASVLPSMSVQPIAPPTVGAEVSGRNLSRASISGNGVVSASSPAKRSRFRPLATPISEGKGRQSSSPGMEKPSLDSSSITKPLASQSPTASNVHVNSNCSMCASFSISVSPGASSTELSHSALQSVPWSPTRNASQSAGFDTLATHPATSVNPIVMTQKVNPSSMISIRLSPSFSRRQPSPSASRVPRGSQTLNALPIPSSTFRPGQQVKIELSVILPTTSWVLVPTGHSTITMNATPSVLLGRPHPGSTTQKSSPSPSPSETGGRTATPRDKRNVPAGLAKADGVDSLLVVAIALYVIAALLFIRFRHKRLKANFRPCFPNSFCRRWRYLSLLTIINIEQSI